MEKMKTAIIGSGKVAHYHAHALQALPESEFTAVYSRDILKARVFADRYGVKAYDDIPRMIRETGVQASCPAFTLPSRLDSRVRYS